MRRPPYLSMTTGEIFEDYDNLLSSLAEITGLLCEDRTSSPQVIRARAVALRTLQEHKKTLAFMVTA